MPVGRIEFNLDTEQNHLEMALKAIDVYSCIHDYDNELRAIVKYSIDYSEDYISAMEDARDILRRCLDDRGIDIEILT